MIAKINSLPEMHQPSGITQELTNEFKNILANKLIFTKFQPVVCLTTGEIIGYEALSRGPEASMFENPAYLFEIAEKLHMLEDLDMLCRETAVSNAHRLSFDTKSLKLFINVDAGCLAHPGHNKGKTLSFVKKYGLEISNTVLEITERAFIKDSKNFFDALVHYQTQGFSIAIDDLCSGNAGLRLVAETNPSIVKIDKFLTENVDTSFKKQAILKMIIEMCHKVFNSKVVAEGIETPEELTTLKELGIDWGQGYLFGKPSHILLPVPVFIKTKISLHYSRSVGNDEPYADDGKIKSIVSFDIPAFSSSTLVNEVVKRFDRNPEILGVPIVDDGIPVGLVMKTELLAKLSKKFGFDLFLKRPVSFVMSKCFLTVDLNECIDVVAKQALSRNFNRLYDAFIITKDGRYFGISTVHALLEKMTNLKIKHALQCNPLTGLPGNFSIKAFIEKYMKNVHDFACIYLDIDHFKAYNDYYGFCRGDEVIRKTAYLITGIFKLSRIGFVGHIGGDDFIAIIHPEEIDELCARFIKEFDAVAPSYYDSRDVQNGYIETLDRKNEKNKFPLLSISLAVVSSHANSRFHSFLELSKVAVEIKKKAKTVKGSVFLTDQRRRTEEHEFQTLQAQPGV